MQDSNISWCDKSWNPTHGCYTTVVDERETDGSMGADVVAWLGGE